MLWYAFLLNAIYGFNYFTVMVYKESFQNSQLLLLHAWVCAEYMELQLLCQPILATQPYSPH